MGLKGKYFYRDPLAAAWMAKHFGMRFNCDVFTTFTATKDERFLKAEFEPIFFIHPDSLHLLEPQVGDNIELSSTPGLVLKCHGKDEEISVGGLLLKTDSNGVFVFSQRWISEPHNRKNDGLIKCDISCGYKIIQRKNIPFMWPERE